MSLSKFFSETKNKQIISPHWGCKPLCCSEELGWKDIKIRWYRHPPYQLPSHSYSKHLLNIYLCDAKIERSLNNKSQNETIQKGDVAIIPANTRHCASWSREIEFLSLEVEPKLIVEIARKIAICEEIAIIPSFGGRDPLFYGVGLALIEEVKRERGNCSVYTELLSRTIAIHLLRQYSNVETTLANFYPKPPTEYKIGKAIEYIQSNLDRDLQIEEIAEKLVISKYYLCKLFSKYLGISPYRYILQQRVEKAKFLLRHNPELKMIDIALECNFNDQSHFNRQFRNFTGTTPRDYRRNFSSFLG